MKEANTNPGEVGSSGFYEADVIHFMRPRGTMVPRKTNLPSDTRAAYEDMVKCGCRFEAEVLPNGIVSMIISNPDQGEDVDVSLTANGPQIQKGMADMLRRGRWKRGS